MLELHHTLSNKGIFHGRASEFSSIMDCLVPWEKFLNLCLGPWEGTVAPFSLNDTRPLEYGAEWGQWLLVLFACFSNNGNVPHH